MLSAIKKMTVHSVDPRNVHQALKYDVAWHRAGAGAEYPVCDAVLVQQAAGHEYEVRSAVWQAWSLASLLIYVACLLFNEHSELNQARAACWILIIGMVVTGVRSHRARKRFEACQEATARLVDDLSASFPLTDEEIRAT